MPDLSPLAGKRAIPENLLSRGDISQRYFGCNNFMDKIGPFESGTSGKRGRVGPEFCQGHTIAAAHSAVDLIEEQGRFGPPVPASMEKAFEGKAHGPVIIGKDVRFVSDMIQDDLVETLTSRGIPVVIQKGGTATPTPVISFEILRRNKNGEKVEGMIATASHNSPGDKKKEGHAGLKTNGFDGGPNTDTKPLDEKANKYLKDPQKLIEGAKNHPGGGNKELIEEADLMTQYVSELKDVVNMDAIRESGMAFGVSPLGGSACGYYEAVNKMYGTNIRVFYGEPDPSGSCRTYDWDEELRGDTTSEFAMMALEGIREKYGLVAVYANDNDADRFGGIDSHGLINPDHALAVAFDYLCSHRNFDPSMGVGRTIATTHMQDAIADYYNRPHYEYNVGFKYFVKGLQERKYVLVGEESGGGVFPRFDGSVWVTEKDGIAFNLLMMEIAAVTGMDIETYYQKVLVPRFGAYQKERIDSEATQAKKDILAALIANKEATEKLIRERKYAGRKVVNVTIGDGVKVELEGGVWVLFRASGTENIIKIYREEHGKNLDTARAATLELASVLNLK